MDALKEGPRLGLSSGKVAAVAAGLSVGVTVGYIFYRCLKTTNQNVTNTEACTITVPVEVYRNISRSHAQFLDTMSQKTGAHVSVLSDSGDPCSRAAVCFLLQGSKEQILLAQCLLKNMASDCEPASEVLEVPQVSFGRIIGRGGESLKMITRTSGAKISCSKERAHTPGARGSVTISGTKQEVKRAKEMILERVGQDALVRAKISQASTLRQKRGVSEVGVGPQGLNNNGPLPLPEKKEPIQEDTKVEESKDEEQEQQAATDSEEESLSTESLNETSKFEIPSPDLSFQPDEHLEVYVSASENPNHFWIQILGVRSLQLDKLTEEMNRFYSSGDLTEQQVETVAVGDIVAAPYRDHPEWNRARVLGVLSSSLLDLYYVDYGDNGQLPREKLRRLRSDFLSLPFQAIECTLAGVKPKGGDWSEEALDLFEKLTHCASWRPLQAKLCSYSHSEVSSWPSVQLCDITNGQILDVGAELVRLGHAVSCQEGMDGKAGGDNLGCLQRMLDDVVGASSELSLSCISLSDAASISGSTERIDDELISDQRDK